MSDSLEQRVARLEARFEISDLLVHYAILLDDCQWDRLGQLFTADGTFASPNSNTVGREAVVANFKMKHAPFVMTMHDPHGSTCVIHDDDHASGTVIGYAELANETDTVMTFIRYQDDYRREDGVWRFAKRHVLSYYGMTVAEFNEGKAGSTVRKRWPGRPVGLSELPDVSHSFDGYLSR